MPSVRAADATLTRLDQSDQGTFGHFVAGRLALISGELPERGNAPNYSRVPAGAYWAGFTYSPHFGRCVYLLSPTAPRAGIRLHAANFMGDSRRGYRTQLNGCIAVGEKLGWMDGQKALLLSAPAVRRLETYFAGRPFQLEIRENFRGG